MSESFHNLIKFPLTQEFIDYWEKTPLNNRISLDGYLALRASREDYSLITEGGIKTKTGYSSVYGEGTRKRIGFRLRVRSQLEDLYVALIELANYTSKDCGKLNPIEVIDYCHVHDRTDREQGYRIRRGVFEGEFANVGGAATQGFVDCNNTENVTGNRYGKGFSFKFMETEVLTGFF